MEFLLDLFLLSYDLMKIIKTVYLQIHSNTLH